MEVIESITDLINKFKKINNNIFLDEIVKIINPFDLCINYEKNREGNIIRIILKIKKNNNTHPLLYYYSNGVVIDTVTWKIISRPPMAFNKKTLPKFIENYYSQGMYDTIKVIDGTVITIYYWNNKWNISTNNSYDVSSFYWIGELTYVEILYDLFNRLYPDSIILNGIELLDNITISFNNLQKNKSYTIGIRHHNFHPLLNDPEYIWNIQNVDLASNSLEYDNGIKGIPNQNIVESITLDQIYQTNKISIQDAMKNENPVYNYGYILRSKNNNVTKEFSNILLSSSLLKKIKKNMYEFFPNLLNNILPSNRFEYIALKNYFNKTEKNDILHLFPQLQPKYMLYSKIIADVVSCSLTIMKNKQLGSTNELIFKPCIISLSYSLLKHINKFEALDPFDKNTEYILKDYYSNIEYSLLFINTINNILK